MSEAYFNSDPRFIIVPIQIRADVRVDVRMPRDLTASEGRKVAAVVQALAEGGNETQPAARQQSPEKEPGT